MNEFAAPQAVAALMGEFDRPWAIAGGWSIDLFLNRPTRSHKDVEIAIFRDDQRALYDYLAGWDLVRHTQPGTVPWHGERIDLPKHELDGHSGDQRLEILFNERDGDVWRYRRNLAVTLPVAQALEATPSGIPALAPEIALLYKSNSPRAGDDVDFAAALCSLDVARRRWLVNALRTCYGDHVWSAQLEGV